MVVGAPAKPLLRPAGPADIPALERLIEQSARALGRGYYSDVESAAAITHVFGVDSVLVEDRTYLLVEDAAGTPLACGGWSFRATLFGGDRYVARDADRLVPGRDAARIRAFFVAPHAARRGLGSRLMLASEAAAIAAGFDRLALMATLPGVPLYRHHGFTAAAPVQLDLGGVPVTFVPMEKQLDIRGT